MTAKEMLPHLKKWHDTFNEIERVYKIHKAAFGGDPEFPLAHAMYKCFDSYTDTVAVLVGDNFGWLKWWLWDNCQGKGGLTAKPGTEFEFRWVKTLRALAKLIEDSNG